MELKNENAKIIKRNAQNRIIKTATTKVKDRQKRLKLFEIAEKEEYNKLKEILPDLNSKANAVLFPIYCSLT